MEYLEISTGNIRSQGEIRKLHKNMSLPRVFTDDVCTALNITPILATPKPEASSLLKQYVRDGVTTDALGNTVQAWVEVDKFSDTEDKTKAEQESEYLETLKEQKRQEMKDNRNMLINGDFATTVPSGGYMIDCDQYARSNLHQAIDNAEIAGLTDADTTTWKMADNNFYTISYGELKLMGLQIAQYINQQFAHEATKNAEIDAASIATIMGVTW